jgi:hypothetical protein
MPEPFYDRLRMYFRKVGEVLRGESDAASIFPNSTDKGLSREDVYARVLRQHLPADCHVFRGGYAFNDDGVESRQIDLIVTSGKALQFNFHNSDGSGKAFTAIEGCIGAVSVKSNLTVAELQDALRNLASLPEKPSIDGRRNPQYPVSGYDDWPYKIVFAFNGAPRKTIFDGLREFYSANPTIPPSRRVNLIHVAGKYGITQMGQDVLERDLVAKKGEFGYFEDDVDVNALLLAILELQTMSQDAGYILFRYDYLLAKMQRRRS